MGGNKQLQSHLAWIYDPSAAHIQLSISVRAGVYTSRASENDTLYSRWRNVWLSFRRKSQSYIILFIYWIIMNSSLTLAWYFIRVYGSWWDVKSEKRVTRPIFISLVTLISLCYGRSSSGYLFLTLQCHVCPAESRRKKLRSSVVSELTVWSCCL